MDFVPRFVRIVPDRAVGVELFSQRLRAVLLGCHLEKIEEGKLQTYVADAVGDFVASACFVHTAPLHEQIPLENFGDFQRDLFGKVWGSPGRPGAPDFTIMWPWTGAKFCEGLSKIGALATPLVARNLFGQNAKTCEPEISEISGYSYQFFVVH